MRQPTVTSPLHSLVAAVPAEALRELVLELLQNGARAPAADAATPVRRRRRGWPKGKPRDRRHEGLPPKARAIAAVTAHPEKTNRAIAAEIGVSVQTVWRARADAKAVATNGHRRAKHTTAKPAAKAQAEHRRQGAHVADGNKRLTKGSPKLLARRKREAQRLRVKRAVAKQAKAGNGSSNGNTEASVSATPTQRFWSHAEMLQPTAPYKAVANEFGTNLAQAKDCYRKAVLPPGMSSSAVERFLELAPPRAEAPPMATHP